MQYFFLVSTCACSSAVVSRRELFDVIKIGAMPMMCPVVILQLTCGLSACPAMERTSCVIFVTGIAKRENLIALKFYPWNTRVARVFMCMLALPVLISLYDFFLK